MNSGVMLMNVSGMLYGFVRRCFSTAIAATPPSLWRTRP